MDGETELREKRRFLDAVEWHLQDLEDVEPERVPRALVRVFALVGLVAVVRASITAEELERSRRIEAAWREFAGALWDVGPALIPENGELTGHQMTTQAEFHEELGEQLKWLVVRAQLLFQEFLTTRALDGRERRSSGGLLDRPGREYPLGESLHALGRLHDRLRPLTGGEDSDERVDEQVLQVVGELDGLRLEVTRSDFEETVHYDYFDVLSSDRNLSFGYFDPAVQGEPHERRKALLSCLAARRWQATVVRRLNELAGTVEMPPHLREADPLPFPYRDDDHLRGLLTGYFEQRGTDLTTEQPVTGLLQDYLQAFTISTPYNAVEPGTLGAGESYFEREFPRALTGQDIHDCGVYAARNAYLLGGVANRRGWNRYLVLTPYHVDVVFTRNAPDAPGVEELPVLVTYNQSFYGDPRLFGRGEGESPRIWYREWQRSCPGDRYPASRREPRTDAFVGDVVLAAHQKVAVLDTPFRLVEVPPSGNHVRDRNRIWETLSDVDPETALFQSDLEARGLADVPLAYLAFVEANAAFYNEDVRHFWNVEEKRARRLLAGGDAGGRDPTGTRGRQSGEDGKGHGTPRRGLDAYRDALRPAIAEYRTAGEQLAERFEPTRERLRSETDRLLGDDVAVAVADCPTPGFGVTKRLDDYLGHVESARTPADVRPSLYLPPYLPRRY